MKDCPFCNIEPDRIIWKDENVFLMRDMYPASPSHALVIPFRHFESIFEATQEELNSIAKAIRVRKEQLDATLAAAGFNIGINEGEAAGQTVPHVHIHIIPRFHNDVQDPRGGIRCVIHDRQRYPVD